MNEVQYLIKQALDLDPDAVIYDVRCHAGILMLMVDWSWGLVSQFWYHVPFEEMARDFKAWTEHVTLDSKQAAEQAMEGAG